MVEARFLDPGPREADRIGSVGGLPGDELAKIEELFHSG